MYKINKKGFTLIELLGVIILLAVIAVAVMALSNRMVSESKESLYETQKQTILSAAEKWTITNSDKLPVTEADGDYNLPISKLATDGYLDSDEVTDPRDNSKICGYVKINYKESKKQYKYALVEEEC